MPFSYLKLFNVFILGKNTQYSYSGLQDSLRPSTYMFLCLYLLTLLLARCIPVTSVFF